MLAYPARVIPDGGGFMVSFVDVPEALTSGATRLEALAMASDALITAMNFYFEDRREIPAPSMPRRNEVLVELRTSIAAKVLLLNELVRGGVRNSELARRMNVKPQEVSRIIDLHHPTKIDTISAALRVLGKTLDVRVSPFAAVA